MGITEGQNPRLASPHVPDKIETMHFTKERPTEAGRYLFKGLMYHPDDNLPRYIPDPIEVGIQPPRVAYQKFVAVGESQPPRPTIKQFVLSVDGKYFGSAERWEGEWKGPLESLEASKDFSN